MISEDIEEIATLRIEDFKDSIGELDYDEATRLRDVLYCRIKMIEAQLASPTRRNRDGSDMDKWEYKAWSVKAKQAQAFAHAMYRFSKTRIEQIQNINNERHMVAVASRVNGQMGMIQALYEIAVKCSRGGFPLEQHEYDAIKYARQMLSSKRT